MSLLKGCSQTGWISKSSVAEWAILYYKVSMTNQLIYHSFSCSDMITVQHMTITLNTAGPPHLTLNKLHQPGLDVLFNIGFPYI